MINVLRNSWSRHLSMTYNQKYEYVLRVTWVGYEFFGTLALGIYLIQVPNVVLFYYLLHKMFPKGETLEELYLAIVILAFEGFPQFMILGLTMVHWHAPFRSEALELFRETRNLNIFPS